MKSGSKLVQKPGIASVGNDRSKSGSAVIEMPGGSGGSRWGLVKVEKSLRNDRECGEGLPKQSRGFLSMLLFRWHLKNMGE